MKFTITHNEINEAITKIGRLISSKTSIPILSGILVQAMEDCLMLTASDGTESIIHRIFLSKDDGNEVHVEGKSVFMKESFDVSKKLKGNITFELVDSTVTVSQNKTKLEFAVMDADEYPKIELQTDIPPLVFTGQSFSDMVSRTTFSAAKNETRPILTGVNMNFKESGNMVTSTDSHRLSQLLLADVEHGQEDLSLCVPASILDQAVKSFDLKQNVMIFPSNNTIAFASGNGKTILISSLLEGVFPDTSRLIPTEFEANLVVNRKELAESLELLIAVAKANKEDKPPVIKLTIGGLFVELATSATLAKGKQEIAFESYDGVEDFTIGFSAQYVLDALLRMDEPSVRLRFNGTLKPFVVVSVNEENNDLQLILPVRQY